MNGVKTESEKEKRDRLAEENLGLVHLCANRFRGRGVEYDELYSAGCMGIVKASAAFDESRGVKFSTYAVPVIMGEIKRIFRDGGTIKVSRSIKELSLRIARIRTESIQKTGREPTVTELAAACGSSEETVTEAIAASSPCISLTLCGEGEDDDRQAEIPSPFRESDLYESIALKEVMSMLSPADRKLIYLRYYASKTQMQTASLLGMTQVQVSRREKKLLEAMRRELV